MNQGNKAVCSDRKLVMQVIPGSTTHKLKCIQPDGILGSTLVMHFVLTLQTSKQKVLQSNLICGIFTQSYVYMVIMVTYIGVHR